MRNQPLTNIREAFQGYLFVPKRLAGDKRKANATKRRRVEEDGEDGCIPQYKTKEIVMIFWCKRDRGDGLDSFRA